MSSKGSVNSFEARDTLTVGDNSYEIYRLAAVEGTIARHARIAGERR